VPAAPANPGMRFWGAALAFLIAATCVAYAPVLDADYVAYDDHAYVRMNEHVSSGLTLANVRWALTGYREANWHPVTWISHMADVEMFGLAARGHHAVNLALHVLNVAVLFLVLRSLTGDALPSFLVAALFALHPGNVESVAWIAQRKSLLFTLFMLLAIAAYARYARGGGVRAYAASLGLFLLSMAAKPMVVTFPFLLLLLDYWPLRRAAFETGPRGTIGVAALARGVLRLVPEKIPFFLLCGVLALVTLDAQQDAMQTLEAHSVGQRLGNVALSYAGYLGTFFAPRNLAVFYPLFPERLTAGPILAASALFCALTLALCILGLRWRYLLVGWLWYVGTMVPVIGFVHVGMQSMADRYVYVPFWGIAIAIAWAGRDLLATRPRAARAALAAACAAFAAFGVLTYRQSFHWHDPYSLFLHALASTKDNYVAHSVLAERYYADGEFAKSAEQSREAVKYGRSAGATRSTYGLALYEMGDLEGAREQFALAADQEADNPIGFMNLGWFHAERGEYDVAIRALETAAAKIGRRTLPYTRKMIFANWANALAKSGQPAAARAKYALALEIDPDDRDVLRDAARADLRLGDPTEAAVKLRRAVAVDPADADAAYLLASAVALAGGDDAELFARAQGLAPRQAVVAIELARTLARDGRAADAERVLERLLAQAEAADPADAQFVASTARFHRGEILLERGEVPQALAELDRALASWPENAEAANRLAFLLATHPDPALRDPARAVALAEGAVAGRRGYAELATLAAAYAAAGRVTDAVASTREALALAGQANAPNAVAALEHQLAVYARMQDGASAKAGP
jgi:protein O-mannosyl-transferase